MGRKLLILFLCCQAFGALFAQKQSDSLRQKLLNAPQDTSKVNLLLHFFDTDLFYDNPEAVIDYTHEALTLSEKLGFRKGEIRAHNNLGYTYRIRSEYDSSLAHYKKAIAKAEDIAFYKGLTDAYMGMGNTYNQLGQWEKAIPNFKRVMDFAEERGDSLQMAHANNNIGNTYLNQSKLEQALTYYQEAVALGDEPVREVALINIAVVHTTLGNLELARNYFEQGLEAALLLDNKGHIPFIYKNLGVVEKKSGNFEKAKQYYQNALEAYTSMSDDYSISEVLYNMGNLHFEAKEYRKAIEFYQRSLNIQVTIEHLMGACYSRLAIAMSYKNLKETAKALEVLEEVNTCSDNLQLLPTKSDVALTKSEIYRETGDYEKALEAYTLYKTLSDSLAGIRNAEKISELETQYQTAQKEQEIDLLNTENEVAYLQLQKQRNLRNYLIITALFLIILIAVVYSRYKLKVRANSKLKDLDKVKTNFFTNISHEFRTPLTLIINQLSKIIGDTDDSSHTEELKLIERNAHRLLELTNQLLDLSKLEAGKMSLRVSPNNLSEFLGVTSATFSSMAQAKNITFTQDFQKLPKQAYFDQDKLQKIVDNLLSNALKFTPKGGDVNLQARVADDRLTIAVHDTGPGLSQEEQQMIFERFQQAENNATPSGTGVGLTLTRELVQLHHGTIAVKSSKGNGAVFTVSIPINKEAYKSSELSEHVPQKPGTAQTTDVAMENVAPQIENDKPIALVVEDNDELRGYLCSLLDGAYAVIGCEDGRLGFHKALEVIPDIVISDWMMPHMNGEELCRNIKKDERTSHIPVVLLTAKADMPSKLDGLKIGADAYMTKPFNNEEFLIRIENLIQQRRQMRAKYAQIITIEPSKVEIADPDKVFIEKAITVVNNHLDDAQFTVQQFQEEMAMSRMQLHRKLKALTNHSASEFVRHLRLQRAADMLSANGITVAEAAYGSGFNSLSYFSQCFKEKFGVTPSTYSK
jgi:signal transduction histidine kinase/DNA-binding response OmpR family regulator